MTAPSVLTVLLLVLLLLNGLALVRSRGGPLTQAPVSALLLALLLVASLPLSPEALPTALLLTTLLGGGAIAFAVMPRRGIPLESGTLRFVVTAVGLALLSGLLLALRPSPFEYPGDSVDYLNTFQRLALQGSESSSCLNQTWSRISYWRECTLWRVLMQVSPQRVEALLSGWPQRTTIALEMAVLGMSCFRLLRCSGVGPLTAGLSWLLIVFGLGNQAIAFVVNNALQGSILAAAVFVEACLLLVWWAGRAWPSLPQVLVLPLGLAPILYLELKLHGAFALTTLALLLPLPLLLGLHTLRLAPSRRLLPRRTAMLLLLACLLLAGLLLASRGGWSVHKQARQIVRWELLGGFGLQRAQLPVSYLIKSPGSRPELLAVAGVLAGFWILLRPAQPLSRDGDGDGAVATASVYRQLSSLYAVGMLVAFLLPPFSHLYIKLPYEVISNYRLMWGVILFSPLPPLLAGAFAEAAEGSSGARLQARPLLLAVLLLVLVLVPFPAGGTKPGQLFWSKSRHLLEGPSERVDLLRISQSLMPSLLEIRDLLGRSPVVLADELLGTALQGYGDLVDPIDPIRVYSGRDDGYGKINAVLRQLPPAEMSAALSRRAAADVVIQEDAIAAYYTPYGETRIYDADIVPRISRTATNAIPAALLQQLGFRPWRQLDAQGRPFKPARAPEQPAYRLWVRGVEEAGRLPATKAHP